MKLRLLTAIVTLATIAPAQAAIQIVYGENPQEELDTENVQEIRNVYEDTLAELEVVRQQREAELHEQNEEELERTRQDYEEKIAQMQAKLEQLTAQVQEHEEAEEAERQRQADRARLAENYNLAVDHTVKVVNHQGEMPETLPPIASEGFDAPLLAAFKAVVPLDWQVFVHQDIDDQKKVTWESADKNWVATLYQLGVRYDYSYDINWDERWVLVNRSDLRLGLSESDRPTIEVMGHEVAPGTEGHMLIDGKVIRVRATTR